jgi:hypothetical protein
MSYLWLVIEIVKIESWEARGKSDRLQNKNKNAGKSDDEQQLIRRASANLLRHSKLLFN